MGLSTENRQRAAVIIKELGRNFSELLELVILGNQPNDLSGDKKSAASHGKTAAAASAANPTSPSSHSMKQSAQRNQPAKKKDPNAPKRNLSSYMLFSQSIRPQIVRENPELSAIDTARLIGEKWNALSDKEKKPFVEKAAQEKARFDNEMKLYNDGLSSPTTTAAAGESPSPKTTTAPSAAAPAAPAKNMTASKPVKGEESNKENKTSSKSSSSSDVPKRKHTSADSGSSKKKSKKHSSSKH
ncbi:high mobility group box domain-containing protein [Mycotypha africana]|uniref:high mobility group box domain-containing protein n=1 Tax=Mycotypha africana TaxID=64632 RepID=UPI0022FFEF2B|nr:high mobility group box domain-containing protein [Mycotypha africana]KAI8990876.1 high mobility group box domain-containing protein [Mycotypha africana]